MTIIHKYSCGCIGIPVGDGKCICISACDRDDDMAPISFYIRDMGPKSSSALTASEQETLVSKLDSLILDGFKMRSLAYSINAILSRDK